ncbi:twinfilin-1-like isoform X2 [Ptychodera flava]|uniref:twinfilin-1-like isoform X2 n=1 Tax=Ptychodera flava TaxID=63121 RepID=UPI00396A0D67
MPLVSSIKLLPGCHRASTSSCSVASEETPIRKAGECCVLEINKGEMSHQTGITCSKDLLDFFAKSKDGSQRLIKIHIENEQLVLASNAEKSGTWEEDFDNVVVPLVEEKKACYILYRLDTTNNQGFEWLLIFYIPDKAPVREKMLYAGSKATLKMEFGGGHIKEEFFGSVPEDVSYAGYMKHLESKNAPPPLTYAEEELQLIRAQEADSAKGIDAKQQTLQGISFPITSEAMDALVSISKKEINYVQLSIDIQNEKIVLEESGNISIDELPGKVPEQQPRYHVFLFKHTHEGDYLESHVFIYTMPGYKCSVKERMLYSSCKAPLVEDMTTVLNMDIAKKMEVDDAKELTEENIYDQVHPKKTIVREKFAKPKGPPGRGDKKTCILI